MPKPSKNELLRGVQDLRPYPAMLCPVPEGGFEVVFPNFPKLKAYGVKREGAAKAGVEILSAHLQILLMEGDRPPAPSDPQRLIPDEDEPAGAELALLAPDKKAILRRLGLERPAERGQAMAASLGRVGRQR